MRIQRPDRSFSPIGLRGNILSDIENIPFQRSGLKTPLGRQVSILGYFEDFWTLQSGGGSLWAFRILLLWTLKRFGIKNPIRWDFIELKLRKRNLLNQPLDRNRESSRNPVLLNRNDACRRNRGIWAQKICLVIWIVKSSLALIDLRLNL